MAAANAGARFARTDWVREAMEYAAFVVDAQQANGAWPYAVDGKDAFIDNFHTCFVMKNLFKTAQKIPDQHTSRDLLLAVQRGYTFYKQFLLDQDGQPRPFAKTQRPSLVRRELYDYAEGINLASLMRGVDPDAEKIRRNLVEVLLAKWQLSDGHFVTRRTILGPNHIPYHRWAQSQTFSTLARIWLEGI